MSSAITTNGATLATDVEECPTCKGGHLCRSCRRAILPQLAQPGWVRLIGKQATLTKAQKLSRDGQRIADRKARKAARKLLRSGALGLLLSAELKAA